MQSLTTPVIRSLETLPFDVIDQILLASASYADLQAAVLSCHALHGVFNIRKTSILAHTLRLAMGGNDVIAASFRTVRIETRLNLGIANVDQVMATIQTIHEDASYILTAKEYAICMARAHVCEGLEVAYSRSFKDRNTDDCSCLTVAESDRFRMALHRLWLCSAYIQSPVVKPLCLSASTRVPLLYGELSVQAVFDLVHVVGWMGTTVMGCLPPDIAMRRQGKYPLVCLSSGPSNVYNAYQLPQRTDEFLPKISRQLRHRYRSWEHDIDLHREILSRTTAQPAVPDDMSTIVELPDGPGPECSKCQAKPGVCVWDKHNWTHVPRNMRLQGLVDWLGRLAGNYYERHLFLQYLGVDDPRPNYLCIRNTRRIAVALSPAPNITVSSILQELLALPHNVTTTEEELYLEGDGFNSVTDEDLLCLPCLEDLVGSRLPVWWGGKKIDAVPDEANKPKCSFGMECSEQKLADHAYDFNHSCIGQDFGIIDGYKESLRIQRMYTKAGKRI
ncbi:hypothetical protein EXIGLDRAFT_846843 [Exidia glandulosa HHB12029]|uniref:Uncharacterized protein n=1 Tax=Exidia glandulosa HHB12029 TaxID=1314781 RepID=A0A166NG45_EXIGL|nr:hypothetical protein EXIGLDRAFT_846843 [Exidia glandulosa HHB12029]